jgi:TonB family protein
MRSLPISIVFSVCLSLCFSQTPPAQKLQTPPSVISKSDPALSDEARRAHVQSTVGLSVAINTDGTPEQIRVVSGAGFGLDESPVESVQQWRFKPGSVNGAPVKVRAGVEVNFRLLPKPGKPPLPITRLNFHLPQGATRPQLISGTMPEDLPASASQNVNLSLQVDTEGAITGLTVLNSTDPEWEALIRDAVNKWKFSPATQNGQPISAEGILDVSSTPAARTRLPAAAVP